MFRYAAIIVLLILLCSTVFYIGALYSCDQGDGTLDGLACSKMKVVTACSDLLNYYKIPNVEEVRSNATFTIDPSKMTGG